jgi:hypothetical protein
VYIEFLGFTDVQIFFFENRSTCLPNHQERLILVHTCTCMYSVHTFYTEVFPFEKCIVKSFFFLSNEIDIIMLFFFLFIFFSFCYLYAYPILNLTRFTFCHKHKTPYNRVYERVIFRASDWRHWTYLLNILMIN